MTETLDTAMLASELRVVLGQLARRLRAKHHFSLAQGSVLGRLDRTGTASIGDLAHAEHVRPQSMTQTINDLEADDLIARRPDPTDGRRTLISLTDRGRVTLEEDRRQRDTWLANAIASDLSDPEQQQLADVLALLRRLADTTT
jgi:DNA-binding MarR family transcriptional regulator